MNRLDNDFYSVELDENGKKVIHLLGYGWFAGDTQGNGLEYRWADYTFAYLKPGCSYEDYWYVCDCCHQYIQDFDGNEILKKMDSFEATPLLIFQVTEGTPCGIYIDKFI